jgi:hypothetical protein
MVIKRDNTPAAEIQLSDLVENILKYSDNPRACAENVTTQIRELIGVRIVALVSNEAGKDDRGATFYFSLPQYRQGA